MTTRPEKPSDNHGGRLEVPCSPIVSVKAFSAQTGELMPLQELERLGHRVAPVDQPFEVTLADWFFTATQGEKKRQGFSYMLIDRNELRALPARLIGTWSTVISLSPRDTVEGFRKVKKWWFYVSPAMAMMFGRFQHLSAHLGHIDRAEPRRIEREIREDLEQLAEITKTIGTTTWGPSKTRPNGYTHFYVTVPKDGKNRLYGLKDPSASPSSFLSRIEFRKILNQTNRAAHIYSHLKASLRWKLPGVTKPTSTPGGQDASPDEIRTLIRDQFDGGDSQPTRAGPFPAFS